MTSTEAQNGFGKMLEVAARGGTVLITRRNEPQAVLISAERYEELTRREAPGLDALTARFDALVTSMQTPAVEAAYRGLFDASPAELGRAAVRQAGKNRR